MPLCLRIPLFWAVTLRQWAVDLSPGFDLFDAASCPRRKESSVVPLRKSSNPVTLISYWSYAWFIKVKVKAFITVSSTWCKCKLCSQAHSQIRITLSSAATSVGAYMYIHLCAIWCFVIHTLYIYIYTGCPRRNVPYFGRVFLMLNYTDITQNTYIQSWTVTEIIARETCGLHRCRRTVHRPWRHTCPMRLPDN